MVQSDKSSSVAASLKTRIETRYISYDLEVTINHKSYAFEL
jgi:hypothetical protein